MKSGANKSDQIKIAKMAAGVKATDDTEGVKPMTAAAISKALKIELEVVRSFMPKKEK